ASVPASCDASSGDDPSTVASGPMAGASKGGASAAIESVAAASPSIAESLRGSPIDVSAEGSRPASRPGRGPSDPASTPGPGGGDVSSSPPHDAAVRPTMMVKQPKRRRRAFIEKLESITRFDEGRYQDDESTGQRAVQEMGLSVAPRYSALCTI